MKNFYSLFLLAIIAPATTALSNNEGISDPFKHYSRQSEAVISQTTIVETPSSMSKRTEAEIVGHWKCVVPQSNAVHGAQLRSIVFDKTGTVEYAFGDSPSRNKQKKATYRIFHKGSVNHLPGKAPTVLLSGNDLGDEQVIPLVDISVDFDSRFPMSVGKRLRFTDLGGHEYILLRDESIAPSASSEQDSDDTDSSSGSTHAVNLACLEKRTVNPALTREICTSLKTGKLTDPEMNKEIIRLMNAGDATCVEVLIEHLGDEHSLVVRQNAIRTLGKVGDKRAVSPLVDILRAPVQGKVDDEAENEAILRRSAVVALGEIGDQAALPILMALANSATDYQSVRDLARITARKLETK